MGLPEQDDIPSRYNSGVAAWEGIWWGPPWGLLVGSSACPPPPDLREPLEPLDVQVMAEELECFRLQINLPSRGGCAIPAQASQLHTRTHRPLWLQV